jgi:hypothetical protein
MGGEMSTRRLLAGHGISAPERPRLVYPQGQIERPYAQNGTTRNDDLCLC